MRSVIRYGPEAAEELVPPEDAEAWAAGAPRAMVWITPAPAFHVEEDAFEEETLELALITGAPFVVVTATGGGGS